LPSRKREELVVQNSSLVVGTGKQLRGKHAVTNWAMVESFAESHAALLTLKLETGRTHQVVSGLLPFPRSV
jgi:23S rRNA-/tRNA-specific pseudouridylate synthase